MDNCLRASISNYLFFLTITFLKAKKLSQTSNCSNNLLFFVFSPFTMHSSNNYSEIPTSFITPSINPDIKLVKFLKITVYSNGFYSESSKIVQLFSMKLITGVLHKGEFRYWPKYYKAQLLSTVFVDSVVFCFSSPLLSPNSHPNISYNLDL